MEPQTPKDPRGSLGLEASQWLARLRDGTQTDPKKSDLAMLQRNSPFLEWLGRSPEHVRMFLETRETYDRLGKIDARGRINI